MAINTIYDNLFLKDHINSIIKFYHPICIDSERGGYINQLNDDGEIYDRDTKHLVGTCRFIYNYAIAALLFKEKEYIESCNHGINYLLNYHRQPNRGFAWVIDNNGVKDATFHCYGHAFVLLAVSISNKINSNRNIHLIYEIYDFLEEVFWDKENRLYVDEICSTDLEVISSYRGQNANMHMCEAMLLAFEITKDIKFFDRAYIIADRICNDLTLKTNGYVWEHYNENWEIDWSYNINDKKNLFRPYGFLSGHFAEWAKLLLKIKNIDNKKWLQEKAVYLFDSAVRISWDSKLEGIFYSFDKNGRIVDKDRYYWVLAEMIAASAFLAKCTENEKYWNWYNIFWKYSLDYFIDKKNGGWYRVLNYKNEKYDNYKSPPAKTDYHPLGACYEILNEIQWDKSA